MPPQTLFSFDLINFDKPLFDLEAIRAVNPQRFEMEQLTAVLHVDVEQKGIIGYKEVRHDEFWVRGHMPEFALMPGVVMCEAAAQLCGFYSRKYNLMAGDFLGFGGMDEVRFRQPVLPGSRLVLMAKFKEDKYKPGRRAEFDFQGFVGEKMAFSGSMIGVPIKIQKSATDEASEG